jgi:hypothetical protein
MRLSCSLGVSFLAISVDYNVIVFHAKIVDVLIIVKKSLAHQFMNTPSSRRRF